MKLGINLAFTHSAVWSDLIRTADEIGLESAWYPDHLVLPTDTSGGPDDDHEDVIPAETPLYDNFALLAHAAAQTSRIRLGTNVYLAGLRHPFVTARGFTTVDHLSAGRVELGVGAGWLKGEFDAVGIPFERRGRVLDEALTTIRRLWADEVIAHQGEFWQWDDVKFEPKPVNGHIPISIGGMSPAALRRVARLGDGWIALPQASPADLVPRIDELRRLCEAHGRDRLPTVSVMVMDRPPAPHELTEWERAGVDRIICRPWTRSSTAVAQLREFGRLYEATLAGTV